MYWLRRLAPLEWDAATEAVGSRAVAFLTPDRSRIFQWAIEYALAGSGDVEQARQADGVWTLGDDRRGSRKANFFNLPDVDPLDPEAVEPDEGMDGVGDVYRPWTEAREDDPPSVLMRSFDSPVARVRHMLCRFRPQTAAEFHRDLAARCRTIDSVSPSVVAGFVHHDTAILAPVVEPLVAWMQELRARPDLQWKERDAPHFLLAAVLPHLDAERQFDLHAGQRNDAKDAFWLGTQFKPLPESVAEDRIRAADAVDDPLGARLTLVATADAGSASATVRTQALDALRRGDPRLRAAAFRAMMRVGEEQDDSEFAASWRRRDALENQAHVREDFWGSLWFARITQGSDDPRLLDALTPSLRSHALEQGGPRMLEAGLDGLAQVLRETGPDDLPPKGLKIDVVRSDDLAPVGDPTGSWHLIGYPHLDEEFEAADGTRARMRDIRDYFALMRRLASAGREVLVHPLSSCVIDRAATLAPDAFGRLATLVEEFAGTDRAALVCVLAHDVARNLSKVQPDRAARLFALYEDVQPTFPEVMPTSRLSRNSLLLWRSADHPAIAAIRHRRLDAAPDDSRIAAEVLAAETAGKRSAIVRYISERMAGQRPVELARAVTAAGFAVEDAALDSLFADERFGHGFLEIAARKAKRSYDLARWAAHWHRNAQTSSEGVDLWRYMELGTACADARCALWLNEARGSYLYECLRESLPGRYASAVSTRDRERRGTLFGQRKPPDWMVTIKR